MVLSSRKYIWVFPISLWLLTSCGNAMQPKDNVLQDSVSIDAKFDTSDPDIYDDAFDINEMSKYQTFDETSMKGVGRADKEPFVYVRDKGDSIFVKSSYNMDKPRVYIKKDKGLWYSRMQFGTSKPCKCEFSQPFTHYDRYFYNDTILEVRTGGEEYGHKHCYVKCGKRLFLIVNSELNGNLSVDRLRYLAYIITKNGKGDVTTYHLRNVGNKYQYYAPSINSRIEYERKSYGLWGIQPGIHETYLYKGRDIRVWRLEEEASDNHIIEGPSFPGGNEALKDYLSNNTQYPLEAKKKNIRGRVVVTFVVETDGSISDVKVAKSVEASLDNEAVRLVSSMPKWIPAKEGGKPIRQKWTLPVGFGIMTK